MMNVSHYIERHLPEETKQFEQLEQFARDNDIPIMEKASLNVLLQLISLTKPKNILEIGTAIGYSALRMYEAYPKANIVTLERNANMYEWAKTNVTSYAPQANIEIMFGEAVDALVQLQREQRTFDFVFIDAAKSHYKRFFTLANTLLRPSGVIVCDNVLFKGYVADDEAGIKHRRLKNLVRKIKQFNEWVMQLENFHSSILPVGDGITVSIKKK